MIAFLNFNFLFFSFFSFHPYFINFFPFFFFSSTHVPLLFFSSFLFFPYHFLHAPKHSTQSLFFLSSFLPFLLPHRASLPLPSHIIGSTQYPHFKKINTHTSSTQYPHFNSAFWNTVGNLGRRRKRKKKKTKKIGPDRSRGSYDFLATNQNAS